MMVLGERYDEYYGFECDDYDAYDPFGEEPRDDSELFADIEKEFGADADAIIASIICGRSTDAAIQDLWMD